MSDFLGIQVEIFAGILIPLGTAAGVAIWRTLVYFHNKELCFQLLKAKVEQLSGIADKSTNTHSDLYKRVDSIEKNLHLIMGRMGIEPVE
jgi:hypothetical protein